MTTTTDAGPHDHEREPHRDDLDRGTTRAQVITLAASWAVLAAGCVAEDVDDALRPFEGLAEGDDGDDRGRPAGPEALGSEAPPPASVSSACLEAPAPATCCTTELLTMGTALADSDPLDVMTAHCVFGLGGDDDYTAGIEADVMVGGLGHDTLDASRGNDTVIGGEGSDTIEGGGGDDWLYGNDGADLITGGSGIDHIHGGAGGDTLTGGSDFDVLIGGEGSDLIFGEGGDDLIVIYHECELGTGELIDGGDGHDVLIAPFDATELAMFGVVLVDVEQVIVDASKAHLAECGPPPSEEEEARSLTMRHEVDLGCERVIPGQPAPGCTETWASTEARTWVDVPQTTTKFLATTDDSTAAITFSALGIGNESGNGKSARSPIHVRALVDGSLIDPGDVRLAFSDMLDPTSFTFVATNVPRGLHVVRFQWMIEDDPQFQAVDDYPIALLHGANVSVSVDAPHTEVAGIAGIPTTSTPFLSDSWSAVEDPTANGPLSVNAYITEGATTTVTFGAEIQATSFGTLEIRAKVDGSTAPFLVNGIRLGQRFPAPYWGTTHPNPAGSHGHASRSFTFVTTGLSEGWHKFTFDGRMVVEGTEVYPGELTEAGIHATSMESVSAAVVSTVDDELAGVEVAVAAAESPLVGSPEEFDLVDGLTQTVTLPADSQVIVHFDADIRDPWSVGTRLVLDGTPVPDSEHIFQLSSVSSTATISTDYILKRLPAGPHQFDIEWEGPTALVSPHEMRDRVMTIRVEPLHTPDLGRGLDIGAGASGTTVTRSSVQALDGERRVLPIIVDPLRPATARVKLMQNVAGKYELKVKGLKFGYETGPGEGAVEVAQGLENAINSAMNLHVIAQGVDPEFACTDGCIAEFLLVADQLGMDGLPNTLVSVTPFFGMAQPVMQLKGLAEVPIPLPSAFDGMLFTDVAAADAYWEQQSHGLLELLPAYTKRDVTGSMTRVVGPVSPTLTGLDAVEGYWWRSYPCDPMDGDTYPYRGGHQRRYWEGLLAADANFDIDFSKFDTNGDGIVRNDELVLVIITPQASGSGFRRTLDPFCAGAPDLLELDGVTLELDFLEWYSANGTDGYRNARLVTHELGHFFELDDMYIKLDTDDDGSVDLGCAVGNCPEHQAWGKSIMDGPLSDSGQWSELDGVHKLSFGWVTPRTIRSSQLVTLEPVRSAREVLVLPRPGSAGREYLLVENRINQDDIDPLSPGFDLRIGDTGLAVWHVVEPEYAEYWEFDGGTPSLGCWEPSPNATTCALMGAGQQCADPMQGPIYDFADESQNYVRRAIRLVRPSAYGNADGSGALWTATTGDATNVGPACGPGTLTWSDGTPSPYQLTNLVGAGGAMSLCVEVDGLPCI